MALHKEGDRRAGLLTGWRAIAAYLGRNQSTAKRWEIEGGLPVHRPKGGAARKGVPVYAFAAELDAWLKCRPETDDATSADVELADAVVDVPLPAGSDRQDPRRRLLVSGIVAGAALLALPAALPILRRGQGAMTTDGLSPEARQLYLDAGYLWQKRTPENLKQAEGLLLRVSELAPGFGDAQADLATVYNLMVEYRVLSPAEGYRKSKGAAERAIALNPGLARAYSVLGDFSVFHDRDYETGLRHFQRALALDPQDGQTRHWYASALMGLGRFEPALEQITRAGQIEPLSRSVRVSDAMIRIGLGQYDTACDMLLQLIANEPGYRSPYRFLAFAEYGRGAYPAYLTALATRFTLTDDDDDLAIVTAGQQAFDKGGFDELARILPDAVRTLATDRSEPYSLAHFLAVAEDVEAAARYLLQTPTRHAFYYGIDPAFIPLRRNARFLQFLESAGLPVIRVADE